MAGLASGYDAASEQFRKQVTDFSSTPGFVSVPNYYIPGYCKKKAGAKGPAIEAEWIEYGEEARDAIHAMKEDTPDSVCFIVWCTQPDHEKSFTVLRLCLNGQMKLYGTKDKNNTSYIRYRVH